MLYFPNIFGDCLPFSISPIQKNNLFFFFRIYQECRSKPLTSSSLSFFWLMERLVGQDCLNSPLVAIYSLDPVTSLILSFLDPMMLIITTLPGFHPYTSIVLKYDPHHVIILTVPNSNPPERSLDSWTTIWTFTLPTAPAPFRFLFFVHI